MAENPMIELHGKNTLTLQDSFNVPNDCIQCLAGSSSSPVVHFSNCKFRDTGHDPREALIEPEDQDPDVAVSDADCIFKWSNCFKRNSAAAGTAVLIPDGDETATAGNFASTPLP